MISRFLLHPHLLRWRAQLRSSRNCDARSTKAECDGRRALQGAKIQRTMVGEGCYVKPGSTIKNSIIGLRTKVGANCHIEDCLVMGADFYETPEDCDTTESCVPMGIGANSCAPLVPIM